MLWRAVRTAAVAHHNINKVENVASLVLQLETKTGGPLPVARTRAVLYRRFMDQLDPSWRRVETRERPQQLALYDHNTVLSVANEHWVSHWTDALSLPSPRRVWCDAPSAYAVQVALDGRIAVAGVGGTVNLYEQATQLTATLRL